MATAINVTSNGTGVAFGGSTAENNKVKAYANFYVESTGDNAALYLHRTPINKASWRLINDIGILKFQCDYLDSDGKKGDWLDLFSIKYESGSIRTYGEITSSSKNAFRMINSNYGAFFHMDNNDLYLMLTNSGSQYGTYNSYRPFRINLPSGVCSINGYPGNVNCGTSSSPSGNRGNIYIQY